MSETQSYIQEVGNRGPNKPNKLLEQTTCIKGRGGRSQSFESLMGSGLEFLQVPGSLSASDTISSLIGPAWGILPWRDSFPSASHYVTVMPGGRQSQKHGAALLKEASPCLMDQPYRPFSLFYKLSQQYPIGTKQVFWTAVPDTMSLMTKDLITPLRDMNS